MKTPKYITELIETGELSLSRTYMKNYEECTFRLYGRNGTEEQSPRSMQETMELAEKIRNWVYKNGGSSEIGDQDYVWWNPYDRYWEKLPYLMFGISDPVSCQIKKMMQNPSEDEIKLDVTVQNRPIAEHSMIQPVVEMPADMNMDENNLIGYFRAYHVGYRWYQTWFDNSQSESRTQQLTEEINFIATQIIYKMFPGGVNTMGYYCDGLGTGAVVGHNERDLEYNVYHRGDLCDCWIRLIPKRGDYNIYIKMYKRPDATKSL
jgi:hypothetical protein